METEFVIGIDLGTTNSCVGIWMGGRVEILSNEAGSRTTPSMVTLLGEEAPLVGTASKNQRVLNPENTIYAIKRIIGRSFQDPEVQTDKSRWPFKIVNQAGRPLIKIPGESKAVTPEFVSSLLLSHLKELAEQHCSKPVTKAVITCPAYFNDSQRVATKQAATIAGLEILNIINEPTAAALTYGFQHAQTTSKILVFDFGGGTLDITVLSLEVKHFKFVVGTLFYIIISF